MIIQDVKIQTIISLFVLLPGYLDFGFLDDLLHVLSCLPDIEQDLTHRPTYVAQNIPSHAPQMHHIGTPKV